MYDAGSGTLVWRNTLVYTSLATAAANQAADGQIVGQQIIIYGSVGGAEDGTYQITVLTGNTSDYTKISDATNTASEVSIVDAGGYFVSTDVEGALQEVGAKTTSTIVPLVNAVATVAAQVSTHSYGRALWEICIYNAATGVRENWTVDTNNNAYTGNDATGIPNYTIYGAGPDANGHTIQMDYNGVGALQKMRLLITANGTGWAVEVLSMIQAAGAA